MSGSSMTISAREAQDRQRKRRCSVRSCMSRGPSFATRRGPACTAQRPHVTHWMRIVAEESMTSWIVMSLMERTQQEHSARVKMSSAATTVGIYFRQQQFIVAISSATGNLMSDICSVILSGAVRGQFRNEVSRALSRLFALLFRKRNL